MVETTTRDFYRGRNVLVTGGSGFMGKVLIEKLLYAIPDIGTIYIIMRPKRGNSVNQRLETMLNLPLFEHLRNERPQSVKKIKALNGDVLLDNFGLSDADIEEVVKNISIIFHFAATLRLEAPLKENVNMNTRGTFRALNFARRVKNLVSFIHLSTAFCYPDYDVLDEKLHAPPVRPDDVMRMVEFLDEKQLALLTPSLLGPHPNCYTFSKRLAESLIEDAFSELPVVVARPSIVSPTLCDPMPGWVDSLNGPVGVMLAAGKGVIRTMVCDGSLVAQVIPVDIAINALIVISMIEGSRKEKPAEIPVYNLNIGHQKPTTWGDVLNVAKHYSRLYPLAWPLWYPNGDITTNKTLHEFRRIFFHLAPAYLIDFLLLILGQKRLMVRIQNKVSNGLHVLQYFTTREWDFSCKKYDAIPSMLNDEERNIFKTDCTQADRDIYMQACIDGGRVYCFKEDPANIPFNRAYHNFLYVLDWMVKIFFWLLVFSYLCTWFKPVKTVFSYGEPVVKHLPFLGRAVFNDRAA